MASQDSLEKLRSALDAVDDELLACLNRRARLVEKVADHKQATGTAFYVPERERKIIDRLTAANAGPFPSDAIRPVVREVISACLTLEKAVRVAYLGPEATFTHQAVKDMFGLSARTVPCGAISGVFAEVERGQADYGVVPVENSTEGVVSHTLDTFVDSELEIHAEIAVEVQHCLLVRHGTAESAIERVYSHPQALAQCRQWLTNNLARASLVQAASTADAARSAQADVAGAAIASELAARMYDLRVLRHQIQDVADNFTRFLVLGPGGADLAPTGRDKTSLLMILSDAPGILYRVLEPLSRAGINMTKIESRPSKKKAWEYVFFVDLDGHRSDPLIAPVLKEVSAACARFQVLGSYPKVERS